MNREMISGEARKNFEKVKTYFVNEVLNGFNGYEYDGMTTNEEKVFSQVAYMYNGNRRYPLETYCLELAGGGSYCLCYNADIEKRLKKVYRKAGIPYDVADEDLSHLYFSYIALAMKEIVKGFVVQPGDSERFFKLAMSEIYIDHYYSDLYVKKNFVSEFIINHFSTTSLLGTFESAKKPYGIWYYLPFCHVG